jgi:hypothetical protein
MKDSRPFAKLKEVFCHHTYRHKNTTFNFAPTLPSPTTIPTLTEILLKTLASETE